MSEEIKTQNEQKNTVATVGMWFSIIGFVLFLSIFLILIWNVLLALFGVMGFFFASPLLFIWFVLWVIWLFSTPRWRARIAVILPLVVFVIVNCLLFYAWKSIKTPVNEFIGWAEPQLEQLQTEENFDEDRFGDILEVELNKIANNTSGDDWKVLFETSTGSNFIEKGAYMVFSKAKEWFENALEKYNDGEIVEIDEDDNHIINVDIDVEDDNIEEDIEDEDTDDEEEITIQQPKKTNSETFSQSEKNDIEQILNILE